jgi:hypothetical protein
MIVEGSYAYHVGGIYETGEEVWTRGVSLTERVVGFLFHVNGEVVYENCTEMSDAQLE